MIMTSVVRNPVVRRFGESGKSSGLMHHAFVMCSMRSMPSSELKPTRTQSEQLAHWQQYRRKLVSCPFLSRIKLCLESACLSSHMTVEVLLTSRSVCAGVLDGRHAGLHRA